MTRRLIGAARIFAVTLISVLAGGGVMAQEATPKHGGTLEFAVTVEPNNYDCDENTSFAFLHPVAPHYSTLLKFDAAELSADHRRSRRILDGVARQPHLYLQAQAQRALS